MLAPSTVGGVNVSCPFHKLDRANLELLGTEGAPGGVTTATVINPRLAGHSARFITASDLLPDLNGHETARALERCLRHYARPALLAID